MNHQLYFRATNIMKKLENTLDNTTSQGIINNIIKYLHSEKEISDKYFENLYSIKSVIIRELKSLIKTHIERICYHDRWSWGCHLCVGRPSRHMEGKELCTWVKYWYKLRWWYKYDEYKICWYPYVNCLHITMFDCDF